VDELSRPGHIAIVLAAGSSSRLGRPKQLLEIDGETLLRRAVQAALATAPTRTVVALGAEIDGCRTALAGLPVEILEVANWAEGMGATLAAAVKAVEGTPGAVLVLGIDQPALSAEHLLRLIGAWRKAPESAVASAYADTVGTPALFPGDWRPRLAQLRGDQGARALLRTLNLITIAAGELALDIDAPGDWKSAVGQVASASKWGEPDPPSGAT